MAQTQRSSDFYQWVDMPREPGQVPMMMLRVPGIRHTGRIRQLQRLQEQISQLGDRYLLPGKQVDFSCSPVSYTVAVNDLRPMPADQLHANLSPHQADQLILHLATLISRLHRMGFLMCTIPPEKVLFDPQGQPEHAVLTGFYDALELDDLPARPNLAFRGPYCAPEVLEYLLFPSEANSERLGPASDVYAIGVLYHLCLTGVLPMYKQTDTSSGGYTIPAEDPVLSRKLDIPHRQLLKMMLAVNADQRPADMDKLCAALQRITCSGNCSVVVELPAYSGKVLMVQANNYRSKRTLDQQGHAVFGPLLSTETYTLRTSTEILGTLRFPQTGSGLSLKVKQSWLDTNSLQSAVAAEAPAAAKLRHQVAEPAADKASAAPREYPASRSIRLDPPLNNVIQIDLLTDERARLTLINDGFFCIRIKDAHLYGIAHLINKEDE